MDYGWVVAYARDEYLRAMENYRRLEDKAAAVGNYLGAGSGLLTLGTVAGVAGGQLSACVTLAALPSVGLALAALIFATVARLTRACATPAGVPHAVEYAEFFGKTAEASYIPVWHEAADELRRTAADKAWWVDCSLGLFAGAVGLLALPLLLAVGRKLAGLTP